MLIRRLVSWSFIAGAALCVLLPCATAQAQPAGAGQKVDFDRDIRPILSDTCFACHGPDDKQRMAGLRLDTREGLYADRGGYQVIVPGSSAKSRLVERISTEKQAQRMPPPYSGKALTEKQVAMIREWVDQGAKWEVHWAYVPPKRPDLPQVKETSWPRNAIDNFILARLEAEGLKHSQRADKITRLRRVTFDLTGLPPTPAEVDSFLADQTPDAYEKHVDQLLQSPHYGERMAMQWLDLARYADTHGYHIDSHRDMWLWRDWVINAYNRNLPFDEFTVEQLAGDLLPESTLEQKIATGFNRNHMINFEGGAIPEEYQNEYVVDRVEATSTVWMGTTMGCARCHDHKYDPIKQRDFYRFYAFFNTIPEKGLDGRAGNAEPFLEVPTPEQEKLLASLEGQIKDKEAALPEAEISPLQLEWEKTGQAKIPEPPLQDLLAYYELDGNFSDSSGHYQYGRVVAGELSFDAGRLGKAAEFGGETEVALSGVGAFERSDSFSLAMWLEPGGKEEMTVLQHVDGSAARRGYELCYDDSEPIGDLKRGSHLSVRLIHQWPADAIEIRTKRRLPLNEWAQVSVTYDGSGKASGLKLFIDGKPEAVDTVKDTLSGPVGTVEPLEIGNKAKGKPYKGRIDDLRIYGRMLSPAEVEQLAIHQPVRNLLLAAPGKHSKDEEKELRDYYLTWAAPENYRQAWAALKELEKQQAKVEKTVPTTMVMSEAAEPRESWILGRGDYRSKLEKVTPGVPSMLPPLPKEAPLNRLTLAKWLVDPAHPLTARVAVNRYWQMYFGTGIVKTVEDFGSQGEAPSNQELLDWLATEFVRAKWDVKAMQRLIVTSAAYQQSSAVTPELLERDPENRLLARGPRSRLPAEVIRDGALAVAGLLQDEIGGPSVYPYQPKGIWEETAYGDVYSAQSYKLSHGRDLYRRSMYTFWKRTSPPPSLNTFDAPDREKCTARRLLTNTPLQALVLMNDPIYIESARFLAQRMITEGGKDPGKRIEYGFRRVTTRTPSVKERQVLLALAREELAVYKADRNAAASLLGVGETPYDKKLDPGELAAWTTVASTMLNMDEAITKE